MVAKSPFRNEHVEAYLEGRFDEVPEEAFELVKAAAEGRNVTVPVDISFNGAPPERFNLPIDPREVLASLGESEDE